MLNMFIDELKLKYNVELDTKVCFYAEAPTTIDNTIMLANQTIEKPTKTVAKKTTTVVENAPGQALLT